MMEAFLVGWSVGGFSMILFGMVYDGWSNYMKALKESKCECKGVSHGDQ